MSDLSKAKAQILVVQFLVPIYDRKGKPYPRSVQKGVRRDLEDRFDGWSLTADKPLTGAWRNPESGQVEYDDSWRYEIGIAPSALITQHREITDSDDLVGLPPTAWLADILAAATQKLRRVTPQRADAPPHQPTCAATAIGGDPGLAAAAGAPLLSGIF